MFEKDRSFGINLYPDEYEDKNREADNNSKKGQYNVESPFNELVHASLQMIPVLFHLKRRYTIKSQ